MQPLPELVMLFRVHICCKRPSPRLRSARLVASGRRVACAKGHFPTTGRWHPQRHRQGRHRPYRAARPTGGPHRTWRAAPAVPHRPATHAAHPRRANIRMRPRHRAHPRACWGSRRCDERSRAGRGRIRSGRPAAICPAAWPMNMLTASPVSISPRTNSSHASSSSGSACRSNPHRWTTRELRPSAPTIRFAVTVLTAPSTITSACGGRPAVSETNFDGRQTVAPATAASWIRASCITG